MLSLFSFTEPNHEGQLRVSKTVLMHSKGSVCLRQLLGSETAHYTEEHPPTLSLSLSKLEYVLGLGIYFECLLQLSLVLPYSGPQMEIEVEEGQEKLGDEQLKVR